MTDAKKLFWIMLALLLATAIATGCEKPVEEKKPECFVNKVCDYAGKDNNCVITRSCKK